MLKQIIAIAQQMNLTITATGIENNFQLNLLKKLGCERGSRIPVFPKPLDAKSFRRVFCLMNNEFLLAH